MTSKLENLYGLWKMTAMRYQNEGQKWASEIVFGGTSMFTRDGQILTFTRTSEIPFGYSGRFTLQGDEMVIQPEVCSIPEMESQTIRRKIQKVGDETLTLGMTDSATGRVYEIDFRLICRDFR